MNAKLRTTWVIDTISFSDNLVPHTACCPQFGNLFEEVIMGSRIERETSHKTVQRYPAPPFFFLDVGDGCGKKHAQLLVRIEPKVTGVIAIKGYRVPAGRKLAAPLDEIHSVPQVPLGWRLVGKVQNSPTEHTVGSGSSKLSYIYSPLLSHNKVHRCLYAVLFCQIC